MTRPVATRSRPIGIDAIDLSKETLIRRRVTHLDQLADKLREDRVRRVILPMVAGSSDHSLRARDLQYVRDLGLVAPDYPGAHGQPHLRRGRPTRAHPTAGRNARGASIARLVHQR